MLLINRGETAFFNAPLFENDANSPRKIKMEIYAAWYDNEPPTLPAPMTMSIRLTKMGEMYIGKGTSSTTPEK